MIEPMLARPDSLLNLFRYKAWANTELFELIGNISFEAFPEQWTTAVRLLNHTLVVDQIFAAHLQGRAHAFEATNTVETPCLKVLQTSVQTSDQWFIHYVSELNPGTLKANVTFEFTDGDAGSMTREEILNHLVIHSTYHRGNIGMLLNACGLDRPKDTLTRFLHAFEPSRRTEAGHS
ncbi:DinB family protein [Allohahella marinimesophila]|uniref:DinB family protein n=1 Tax=Allohahella marinimesophila TaxID=1054972 RepID=A0ABP7PGS8_9GAMM